MRTFGKWLGRLLVALILAIIVVGVWKREQVMRLWAVNTLFDEGRIVGNFSHMDAAFRTVPLPRGTGPVSALAQGPAADLPAETAAWIADRRLTSLLVMKEGSDPAGGGIVS